MNEEAVSQEHLVKFAVALTRELDNGALIESPARHLPWGSEIDVVYPGGWRRLWCARRAMLLVTYGGQVVMIKRNGTRVKL